MITYEFIEHMVIIATMHKVEVLDLVVKQIELEAFNEKVATMFPPFHRKFNYMGKHELQDYDVTKYIMGGVGINLWVVKTMEAA